MWKATAGLQIQNTTDANDNDDDWETDADFVNDVTEEEQRWGSKTIEGSGRTAGTIDMDKLRTETEKSDHDKKKKQLEEQNPGYGYGGKFGVQTDRMDKSAVGHDYHGKVEKHASQKDYSDGFGGKFGVQKDRVDKSAAGWDHVEKVEKHASQKDYSKGFGGKFGIEEDRKDKSAVGWDHIEAPQKHESQLDHKVGFGGKFGVQKDRMDKSAAGYADDGGKQQIGTSYTKVKPNIEGAKPSNLRAKFENLAKNTEEDNRKRAEEQKRIREEKDRKDREEAAKKTIVENTPFAPAEEARAAPPKASRTFISTGRTGGIGNAISAFNKMQSPTTETPPARKDPIALPKGAVNETEQPAIQPMAEVKKVQIEETPRAEMVKKEELKQTVAQPQPPPPDVIPSIQIQHAATPPETLSPPVECVTATAPAVADNEALYQNQEEVTQQKTAITLQKTVEPTIENSSVAATVATAAAPPTGETVAAAPEEAIYANSENLADYIEDTGLRAVALYDYQAADDDEISFDPDDEVSHIEMIDEGWWRGLCKNRYGLFPANYVQLINQQQT